MPREAATALHEFGGALGRSLESAGGRAKREDLEKLHATLHFLGDVEDGIVPALGAAMRDAAGRHAAFDVVFEAGGAFPKRGKPRIVFAAVGQGAAALSALAADVASALVSAGATPPDKPFHAHVTLLRVKVPPRGRWQPPEIAAPVPAHVGAVTLFASELAARGAIHTAIATGNLRTE